MSDHSDYSSPNSRSRSLSQSHSHSYSHSRDLTTRPTNDEKTSRLSKKLDSPGSKEGSSRPAARTSQSSSSRRDVMPKNWANIPAPVPPSPTSGPMLVQQMPLYIPPVSNNKKSRTGSQLSMPLATSPHHYLPHQPTTPPTARFQQQPPPPPPPQRVLSAPMPPQFGALREFAPSSPSHASFSARGSASRPSSSGGMHHVLQDGRRSSRRGSKSSPKKLHKNRSSQFLQRSAWPPPGYSNRTRVSKSEMRALVGSGALEFGGTAAELPFTKDVFRYYTTVYVSSGGPSSKTTRPTTTDTATWQYESLKGISLSFMSGREGKEPNGSLEYPNMLYAFGKGPGTTTLTWFVGMKGQLRTPLAYDNPTNVKKRKMKLISILERLNEVTQKGLEENPNDQYHVLYDQLIEDPDRNTNPHFDTYLQIIDLMRVLMGKEWTDFSLPKNQVVAKFFDSRDDKIKQRFFHQLLLAVELHLRIQDNGNREENKRRVLDTLPPKVLWDLALAQRWLENMAIHQDNLNDEDSEFTFHLSSKRRQKEALMHFAGVLKWPNMEEINYVFNYDDEAEHNNGTEGGPLEEKSADTMSWFTGVILPGPTLPFLIMNSLIDCDDDTHGRLAYLTHVRPNCGFQYRANTYWSYKCVLGKVLGAARGVREVAGWIGPCHFSPDLARTQCALISTSDKQTKDEHELRVEEVKDMDFRSDVLGHGRSEAVSSGGYIIIGDYEVPVVPLEKGEFDDEVRIQKIAFKECSQVDNASTGDLNQPKKPLKGPKQYNAAVVFAFGGRANVPVRLKYDVDFVQAPTCESGPHALWRGYKTRWVRVDSGDLRDMRGLDGPDLTEGNGLNLLSSRVLAQALGTPTPKRTSTGSNGQEKTGDYYQYDWYERDWDRIDHGGSGTEHLQSYLDSSRDRKFGSDTSSSRRRETSQFVIRARGDPRRNSPYGQADAHSHSGESEEERESAFSTASNEDSILLIDATGVSDHEVFARAWCSHWGLDAVVAVVSRTESAKPSTCVACAVRMAVAAKIGVVILTEGGMADEKDTGVWEGYDQEFLN